MEKRLVSGLCGGGETAAFPSLATARALLSGSALLLRGEGSLSQKGEVSWVWDWSLIIYYSFIICYFIISVCM